MDRKRIRLLALLAALTCLASGCGKDEEKEEPHTLREYALGNETVAALQPEEEDVQGVKDLTQVYRYSGLENAGATVSAYVDLLTDSENGFSVVDANFVRTEKPDFTQDAGTVRLARRLVLEEETTDQPQEEKKEEKEEEDKEQDKDEKEAEEKKEEDEDKKDKDGEQKEEEQKDKKEKDDKEDKTDKDEKDEEQEKDGDDQKDDSKDKAEGDQPEEKKAVPKKWLVTVQIDWRAGNCVVTVDQKEGSITSPKKKAAASGAKSMSLFEAVDYFKSLSPGALGLEGASMDAYQVQIPDGVVMVDDRPCMQLRVYDVNTPEGTNDIKGNFLMTNDGAHLYRLDELNHTVQEIPVSGAAKADDSAKADDGTKTEDSPETDEADKKE